MPMKFQHIIYMNSNFIEMAKICYNMLNIIMVKYGSPGKKQFFALQNFNKVLLPKHY